MTYIVSRPNILKKYISGYGISHTIVGLSWRRRHIFIVKSDDCEGLHWLVCAMDCRVLVWAFKVWIWEPLPWYFLSPANVETPPSKGCFHTCSSFGVSKGMVGHVAMNRCIFVTMWLAITEA